MTQDSLHEHLIKRIPLPLHRAVQLKTCTVCRAVLPDTKTHGFAPEGTLYSLCLHTIEHYWASI